MVQQHGGKGFSLFQSVSEPAAQEAKIGPTGPLTQ